MKLEVKFSISLNRRRPIVEDEEEEFEHRDTDAVTERSEPQRVGFDIPTTGDDRTMKGSMTR